MITALDDTVELMKDTSARALRYGVRFTPEMQGMVDCPVRAAVEIRDAMPLLGSIDRSAERPPLGLLADHLLVREQDAEVTALQLHSFINVYISPDGRLRSLVLLGRSSGRSLARLAEIVLDRVALRVYDDLRVVARAPGLSDPIRRR